MSLHTAALRLLRDTAEYDCCPLCDEKDAHTADCTLAALQDALAEERTALLQARQEGRQEAMLAALAALDSSPETRVYAVQIQSAIRNLGSA